MMEDSQATAAAGVEGRKCVVTGGSGLVGRRLVEMLVERGAREVVSFDVRAPDPDPAMDFLTDEQRKRVTYVTGDLTKPDDVVRACEGADCVWHIAALVGPFHPLPAYYKVNYEGTLNVIAACKKQNVPRLIGSSSPSTRFDGSDVDGLTEDQVSIQPAGKFLEPYAETKAMGETALREACDGERFFTVAIAPHQVYGPRDSLFLPNLMAACKSGKLRVFGNGENKVSFTHVDNYCHGLIHAYTRLFKGSPALGKYYVVTDGGFVNFWRALDEAAVGLGFSSLFARAKLPYWLIMGVARVLSLITMATGVKFRVSPFTVKMLTIHRWFDIANAERDLGYEPLVTFEKGWKDTIQWFKEHDQWWQERASATLQAKK